MLDELLTRRRRRQRISSEARKIFYSEAPERAIRGRDPEEHDELVDEGIPVARFPCRRRTPELVRSALCRSSAAGLRSRRVHHLSEVTRDA